MSREAISDLEAVEIMRWAIHEAPSLDKAFERFKVSAELKDMMSRGWAIHEILSAIETIDLPSAVAFETMVVFYLYARAVNRAKDKKSYNIPREMYSIQYAFEEALVKKDAKSVKDRELVMLFAFVVNLKHCFEQTFSIRYTSNINSYWYFVKWGAFDLLPPKTVDHIIKRSIQLYGDTPAQSNFMENFSCRGLELLKEGKRENFEKGVKLFNSKLLAELCRSNSEFFTAVESFSQSTLVKGLI